MILKQLAIRRRLWLLLLLLCAGNMGAPALAEGGWKAGVARANITPEHFMWMAGYGSRTRPAEGKYSDLWVKSLVLEDSGGHRGLLITMDLVGIDRVLEGDICTAVGKRYGLSRAQIALCTSHTHSGPVVGRNLAPLHYLQVDKQQQALIDAYAATLKQKILTCVDQAVADLEACRLSWGSGQATFAVNRRNNPEREVPRRRAENQLKGPCDHDVPVLAIHKQDGKLKTIVFGYACHATTLNEYQWSGDYPGFAQSDLETAHPGAVAMFWAGCGADQNPIPRRSLELARQYGSRLAAAVDEVLSGDLKTLGATLHTSFREIALRLDKLPAAQELEQQAKSENRYTRARAQMLLRQIAAGTPLQQAYPYPVGAWLLGDQVEFVFLGGEVVVDFALRLKAELRGTRTWVAGYSNDVMAYIPSLRVLREGGYEGANAMVYYGLPTSWAPQVEQQIVDQVHALIRSMNSKHAASAQ